MRFTPKITTQIHYKKAAQREEKTSSGRCGSAEREKRAEIVANLIIITSFKAGLNLQFVSPEEKRVYVRSTDRNVLENLPFIGRNMTSIP